MDPTRALPSRALVLALPGAGTSSFCQHLRDSGASPVTHESWSDTGIIVSYRHWDPPRLQAAQHLFLMVRDPLAHVLSLACLISNNPKIQHELATLFGGDPQGEALRFALRTFNTFHHRSLALVGRQPFHRQSRPSGWFRREDIPSPRTNSHVANRPKWLPDRITWTDLHKISANDTAQLSNFALLFNYI